MSLGLRFFACGGVVAAVALVASAIGAQPTPQRARVSDSQPGSTERVSKRVRHRRPRWDLLSFRDVVDNPSLSHRITRIKITLPEKQATPWQAGWTGDEPLVYETNDQRVLDAMEQFLTFPLRMAVPRGLHGGRGDGSSSSVGTITVITNTEEFTVNVSRVGFVLDSDVADYQNIFYSWGLAHFLDDISFERLNVHIPPKIMKELTGEARIEQDRKALEVVKASPRPGSVKGAEVFD